MRTESAFTAPALEALLFCGFSLADNCPRRDSRRAGREVVSGYDPAGGGARSSADGSGPLQKPQGDLAYSKQNIDPIRTPILILVGTADPLFPVDRILHDMLDQAGKSVRMEVYENGYHDFCLGPQGHKRQDLEWGTEVLLDSTLAALEKSLLFLKGELH
jgi:acetyl esterase/lipase